MLAMDSCASYGFLCSLWIPVLARDSCTRYGFLYKVWILVLARDSCTRYGFLYKLWIVKNPISQVLDRSDLKNRNTGAGTGLPKGIGIQRR